MPNIEFIPLQLVDDYDKNSNTHPQAQIENIKALMLYVGWTVPALVRKTGERYGLIAGHGRREAASELQGKPLKMADGTPIPAGCIPVLFADGWSEEQIRAYVIADNQVPRQSIFDESILAEELQALQDGGLDLGLDLGMIGFDEGELERLLASMEPEQEYQTDPDDAPEVDEESTPVSVRGMVWLCGNHRVMCGDSTSEANVKKLMNGNKADILFTDPPYGIDFSPQRGTHGKIMNDALSGEEFNDFLDLVFSNALSVMKPNTYAFVWTGWPKIGAFEKALQKCFKIQAMHIWVKNNFGIGYYSRPKHEPFYLCLNGKPVYPSKAPADVWEAKKVHKTIHSCEKPVGLIIDILDTYHKNSETLDLFGGSGSTLIACEKTSRINYSMELDEKYVDVIVKRWQQFTGKQATLENDGRTFNEIASLCP